MQQTDTFLTDTLEQIDDKGLSRTLRTLQGKQSAEVNVNGKRFVNFCSNNYLGLADDARIVQAAKQSIDQEGFGSGASRLICGNLESHKVLEKTIADFKGTESCLTFSTGYMANVGIISSLFGRNDIIFSDRLNHASIIDGIILSRARWRRYAHSDMSDLERMLQETSAVGRRCIITDSVFSMDGDVAPLNEIVNLAQKYDCMVMVDEAHAFGVMGKHGKGAVEYFDCAEHVDIQMGTLSKAAGTFGAYCCGSNKLTEFLINKARSFIYTTGMPPSTAAAANKAVEIIKRDAQRRQKLWSNTDQVRKAVKALGYDTLNSQTPIIPIIVGDSKKAKTFADHLYEDTLLVNAIRPPTVPQNTARLRITLMATHTQEQINKLLNSLEKIGKDLCLI